MKDLYQPGAERFAELSRDHAVVPVWREVLADLSTPLAVYDQLRRDAGTTFLLESVEHGERWGRHSFIGLRPFLTLRARSGVVTLEGDAPEGAARTAAAGDPLATLEALLSELRTPDLPGLPPLYAGAVGYLGYDVVRFVERLPDTCLDDLGMNDVHLVFPGQVVAFDHLRQRLVVVINVRPTGDPRADYDKAVEESESLVMRLGEPVTAAPVAPPQTVRVPDSEANMTREDFLKVVERAKEHIRAGDVFQVVASQRFSQETTADPFAVYRVLRVINPSPYLYLFDFGDVQVVGSSPEALVTVRGGRAEIWPIAGSQPRGADDEEDARREAVLTTDEKERAEHVMLVDLARNDLGRVCEVGSVRVGDFAGVVRYSHIMHLVSKVAGTLRPGVNAVDVLRATFPAGTLSGAPKVRAMEIIDDLEPTRRGLYGGGIGYLDLSTRGEPPHPRSTSGNLDLCIAIRTLLFHGGRAYVQAGAGIVADSVPEKEYAETQDKAMALLAAVKAAETLRGDP